MKCFIVTGMHSSATSLVAEGLARAGVKMWLNRRNGHWEDVEIMRLNEWMLIKMGGDWKKPGSCYYHEDDLYLCRNEAIEAYEQRESQGKIWGMKDPRFVFTWPVWKEVLDLKQTHFISIYRDTNETAESCQRRWGRHKNWKELVRQYKRQMREIERELI